MNDALPQRFRYRARGFVRWKFGQCVPLPSFEMWLVQNNEGESAYFDDDPWEVLGQLLGDVEFQWIDNDHGWHGDVMPRSVTR